jgi:hypothetical protein
VVVSLRSHAKLGAHLEGVIEWVAHSSDELQNCIRYACSMRAVHETAMNAQSSRSHAVFIVKVERPDENMAGTIYVADLAGHESEKTSKVTGEQFRELSFINTTLHFLRQVISALADKSSGRNKAAHVPYRNSKLTLLLEPGLEGKGRVSTIVTVTPAASGYDENLHSLRFATDLSDIRVKVAPQAMATKASLLAGAHDAIKKLKEELAQRHTTDSQLSQLQDELENARKMAQIFQASWDELNQKTMEHRSTIDARLGLSMEHISGEAKSPYLVNLSDDPSLSGAICYEIPPGFTLVGSDPALRSTRGWR